ncbi:MAG: sugar MFS transporter [Bacteroidales bacterium]|nr:sugar MFS transporter [Bacteroidales bacterium]MDY4620106.1 sugar MFS transporter [Alloprevotella sp.]
MKHKTLKLVRGLDGTDFLAPFVLVTSLFFLWGFAHSILDVLNKHFQETLHINKTQSAFIQMVLYGGYFLMALPAGRIISRFGYRAGVLSGLCLYGIGALLFIPGSMLLSFPFFLFSLFVIGCGLTCLETAANPYVTVLGSPQDAERRINLAQSLNGLGWIVGPLVGGLFLFSGGSGEADIATPYTLIGVAVLLVAVLFSFVKLPDVQAASSVEAADESDRGLWSHRHFVFGLGALFLYVAAQTGINSFFINYVVEEGDVTNAVAALMLSFGRMGFFLCGRISGFLLMKRIRPEKLLIGCALGAIFAMSLVIFVRGVPGMGAIMVCSLCESIMFPTIFAFALRGLGRHTKTASSYLIMCIVGGAVAPVLMGMIADTWCMAWGFLVPLCCFVYIAAYGRAFLTGRFA